MHYPCYGHRYYRLGRIHCAEETRPSGAYPTSAVGTNDMRKAGVEDHRRIHSTPSLLFASGMTGGKCETVGHDSFLVPHRKTVISCYLKTFEECRHQQLILSTRTARQQFSCSDLSLYAKP
jgi:hypothetical protein